MGRATVNLSPAGLALIKSYESLSLEAYWDPAGFPTQGWGRKLSNKKWAALSRWPPIDRATAPAWLLEDVQEAEAAVGRRVRVDLTQSMFDALASFFFNLGDTWSVRQSGLLRKVNAGKHALVPKELTRWVKSGGLPLVGLARRRVAEAALYLS